MRTFLWIVVIICILSLIGHCVSSDKSEKQNVPQANVTAPKAFNIDSLCAVIKTDDLFKVKLVKYDKTDSSLRIFLFLKKDELTMNYIATAFSDTYNIDSIDVIDGVKIYPVGRKKYVSITSKRAAKLVDKFKEGFCTENYCSPLVEYIKSTMNDPNSFEADKLDVSWYFNDPTILLVDQSFRGKNAFGGLILNKVEAEMDAHGNILSCKQIEVN